MNAQRFFLGSLFLTAGVLLASSSCSEDSLISPAADNLPAAGAAGTAGQGGVGGSDPSACPDGPGPRMVRIDSPKGSFCMDTTEVTQGDYGKFIQAKGKDTSGQIKECEWNNRWLPLTDPEVAECAPEAIDFEKKAKMPMGCVDWCDAYAYCSWAGKRLCGKLGGGAWEIKDPSELVEGEWSYACSQGGKTKFPYGNNYEPDKCNGYDKNASSNFEGISSVDTDAGCKGESSPFSLIQDLSGNVSEWEGGCGQFSFNYGSCGVRGGSVSGGQDDMSCEQHGISQRSSLGYSRGFRCCAD